MTDAAIHKPRVLVSACLMGQPVRFNGGHTNDRFLTDRLSGIMELTPLCPEMEAGMGTPRPAIQLRRTEQGIRLVQSSDPGIDHTDRMRAIAQTQAERHRGVTSGLVVQKKSPTCGMERVPVSSGPGKPSERNGVGIFVEQFMQHAPLIPVEENGRLNDPVLRENFLERVYALDRWYRLDPGSVPGFIEFHAQHKLMLMARGSEAYRKLGRVVAGVTPKSLDSRREAYINAFMSTLKNTVNRKHHYNVLQHIMGYFKNVLTRDDKHELLGVLDAYRAAQVPLATPMMLLNHYLRKHPNEYLTRQHYLDPYPALLALRATV